MQLDRLVRQVNDKFQKVDKSLNSLDQEIVKVRREQMRMQHEMNKQEIIESTIKIYSGVFDKSIAYANVIIIAGYVSFFTIWSFTREHLSESATIWTAILMGVSIIVFVVWEIFRMILSSIELQKLSVIINSNKNASQLVGDLNKTSLNAKRMQLKMYRIWLVILVLTVSTGFSAAFILVYNFAVKILMLPSPLAS